MNIFEVLIINTESEKAQIHFIGLSVSGGEITKSNTLAVHL